MQLVDIGLGFEETNTARVFSLLQNVTKNDKVINTFPNIYTSVEVLTTLSGKNVHPNGLATNVSIVPASAPKLIPLPST